MALIFCFVGSIAILAPWVFTQTGRRVAAGLTPAFLATYAWLAYELVIESKPHGRVDLIVLVPLFALVCLSGLASILLGAVLDEMKNPDRGAHGLSSSVQTSVEDTSPEQK